MRIADTNYVDEATLFTASSENASYPIENTQDQRLSLKYQSTGVSTILTITGATLSDIPAGIALLSHNLTSSATIVFQLSKDSDFSTGIHENLTWNEGIILKFFNYSGYDTELLDESGSVLLDEDGEELVGYGPTFNNYIYYKFTITDSTNPDAYIELGRVWVGPYISISPSSLLDFKVTYKNSDTNIYGLHRTKFALPGVVWRKFDFNFPKTNTTMLDQIQDFIDNVGTYKSFIFCNFDTIRGYEIVEPCYVSLTDNVGFTHESNMQFKYSISMEEDL